MVKNIGRKPAILQVLPSLMAGNLEKDAITLAAAIESNGFRSFIASTGGNLVNQLYKAGGRHFELPLNTKNPFVISKNISELIEIIIKYDIEIIHAQSREVAWMAYFAAKKTGCKFISTVHNAHSLDNYLKKLYNSVVTKGPRIVAVSNFVKDHLAENYKLDRSQVEVVHCGTDLNLFNYEKIEKRRIITLAEKYKIPTDRPIILVPGKIAREKGHIHIIEAIKMLPRNSVSCIIAGDDTKNKDYRKELQDLITYYDLSRRIIILNNITDIPALYALSDIVISAATKPEAFNFTSIEAQAMGRMMISTNIGSTRETLIDGKTGWLVEPNNPPAIAKAIIEVTSMDIPQRLYRASLARSHVELHFSLNTNHDKMIHIYGYMLGFS